MMHIEHLNLTASYDLLMSFVESETHEYNY